MFQKSISKLWITHLSQFFQHIFIKVLRNICQQFFHHIFNASFKSLSTNYGSQHLSQFCQQFFHNIFIKVFQHIITKPSSHVSKVYQQTMDHNIFIKVYHQFLHHIFHTSCITSLQFFTKSPKHVLVDLFLMKCY